MAKQSRTQRADARLVARMANRIMRQWDAATAAELAEGLEWYARAEQAAETLSAGTPYTTRQCAAVIAATSPRQQWAGNLLAASILVDSAARGRARRAPRVGGFPSNAEKAWRILHGEDPDDVLGGPKVRAFFANITGDTHQVTCDVWAVRAALGSREWDERLTTHRYRLVADAFRAVADLVGVAPRDVQAAVWVSIRNQWRADGRYREV